MRNQEAMRQLTATAAAQYGLVTNADMAEAGVKPYHVQRLVRAGVLERVARGVHRFSGTARSWEQRVLVAVFDGGPLCVASHRTAAALHRYDGFPKDVIEVLVPMHVFHRRSGVIVHHTRDLPDVDRDRVGPIPVTSPARTLIDLGSVVSADRVEETFDGAERDKKVKREHVQARYQQLRARGRDGIGAMTLVLRDRGTKVPHTVLERRMLRLLDRARLPRPSLHHWVKLGPTVKYEIDFAYVDPRIGLEVDGHGSHATRRERAYDATRTNRLENAGWTIRRFTYEQVRDDPASVAETVRAALRNHI